MTGDQDALGGATGFGATIGAVQGTRSAQQNLTVDGLVANDMGAPAGLSGQVNMDAVQEVKVPLSTYQAEYGRNPGANISMTTRAGTKEYHGSAYYYGRNDAFNANDFFRNRSPNPSLNSEPALYRFHTFGGTFGGPIPLSTLNHHREKLFFFYSFDKTLSHVPDAGGGLEWGRRISRGTGNRPHWSVPAISRNRQPSRLIPRRANVSRMTSSRQIESTR
jgi:hypothetical protein